MENQQWRLTSRPEGTDWTRTFRARDGTCAGTLPLDKFWSKTCICLLIQPSEGGLMTLKVICRRLQSER